MKIRDSLLEECDGLLTEAIFNHRQILLEGYWGVGKIIYENNLSLSDAAKATRQLIKTMHYCKELYRLYPDLSALPDGKVASWYKMCKILPKYEG